LNNPQIYVLEVYIILFLYNISLILIKSTLNFNVCNNGSYYSYLLHTSLVKCSNANPQCSLSGKCSVRTNLVEPVFLLLEE
jgi:hypothetical protein